MYFLLHRKRARAVLSKNDLCFFGLIVYKYFGTVATFVNNEINVISLIFVEKVLTIIPIFVGEKLKVLVFLFPKKEKRTNYCSEYTDTEKSK